MEQIDQSKEQFVSSLGGDIEFKRYLKNVGITDEIFDRGLSREFSPRKSWRKYLRKARNTKSCRIS
jgi:hypothetical protein